MQIPIINQISKYANPKHLIKKYSEKVTAIFIENSLLPISQITIAIPAGAVEEEKAGLANFVMQMLVQGTTKRSAEEISKFSERIGMKLNSHCNWDESYIGIQFLNEFKVEAFDLITDCFFNSSFLEEEVKGLKVKLLAQLEMRMAEPEYLAHIGFSNRYFDKHNYSHPYKGTKESLNSITVEDCFEMYEYIKNQNIYVVFAGGLSIEEGDIFIKKYIFDKIESKNINTRIIVNKFNDNNNEGIFLIDKTSASQAYVSMGFKSINRENTLYPQFQLINAIYGGYFGSRLNKIIREEKGYTYGVHSYNDSRKYASVMRISMGIAPENIKEVLEIINTEIDRLKSELISEDEFITAKNYICGSFLRSSETVFQTSSLILSTQLNGYGIDFYEKFIEHISNASPEDIQNASILLLSNLKWTTAISGDIAVLEKQLSQLDKVSQLNLA